MSIQDKRKINSKWGVWRNHKIKQLLRIDRKWVLIISFSSYTLFLIAVFVDVYFLCWYNALHNRIYYWNYSDADQISIMGASSELLFWQHQLGTEN